MTLKQRQLALDKIALALQLSTCPLRKGATQPVAGEGAANAKLLFIGEAPGRNEDLQGRPFVGAAGRILTELLAGIGLKREDIFITSIEKFRPPKNRDPKPKEIFACFPYLEKQIAIIRPQLIVCLGRHALRRMLEWEKGQLIKGELPMQNYHGKLIRGTQGRNYFPVYHPAAALYGLSRQTLKIDFQQIPKVLSKLS